MKKRMLVFIYIFLSVFYFSIFSFDVDNLEIEFPKLLMEEATNLNVQIGIIYTPLKLFNLINVGFRSNFYIGEATPVYSGFLEIPFDLDFFYIPVSLNFDYRGGDLGISSIVKAKFLAYVLPLDFYLSKLLLSFTTQIFLDTGFYFNSGFYFKYGVSFGLSNYKISHINQIKIESDQKPVRMEAGNKQIPLEGINVIDTKNISIPVLNARFVSSSNEEVVMEGNYDRDKHKLELLKPITKAGVYYFKIDRLKLWNGNEVVLKGDIKGNQLEIDVYPSSDIGKMDIKLDRYEGVILEENKVKLENIEIKDIYGNTIDPDLTKLKAYILLNGKEIKLEKETKNTFIIPIIETPKKYKLIFKYLNGKKELLFDIKPRVIKRIVEVQILSESFEIKAGDIQMRNVKIKVKSSDGWFYDVKEAKLELEGTNETINALYKEGTVVFDKPVTKTGKYVLRVLTVSKVNLAKIEDKSIKTGLKGSWKIMNCKLSSNLQSMKFIIRDKTNPKEVLTDKILKIKILGIDEFGNEGPIDNLKIKLTRYKGSRYDFDIKYENNGFLYIKYKKSNYLPEGYYEIVITLPTSYIFNKRTKNYLYKFRIRKIKFLNFEIEKRIFNAFVGIKEIKLDELYLIDKDHIKFPVDQAKVELKAQRYNYEGIYVFNDKKVYLTDLATKSGIYDIVIKEIKLPMDNFEETIIGRIYMNPASPTSLILNQNEYRIEASESSSITVKYEAKDKFGNFCVLGEGDLTVEWGTNAQINGFSVKNVRLNKNTIYIELGNVKKVGEYALYIYSKSMQKPAKIDIEIFPAQPYEVEFDPQKIFLATLGKDEEYKEYTQATVTYILKDMYGNRTDRYVLKDIQVVGNAKIVDENHLILYSTSQPTTNYISIKYKNKELIGEKLKVRVISAPRQIFLKKTYRFVGKILMNLLFYLEDGKGNKVDNFDITKMEWFVDDKVDQTIKLLTNPSLEKNFVRVKRIYFGNYGKKKLKVYVKDGYFGKMKKFIVNEVFQPYWEPIVLESNTISVNKILYFTNYKILYPALSPDGMYLAFFIYDKNEYDLKLGLLNINTGSFGLIISTKIEERYISDLKIYWASDSNKFLFNFPVLNGYILYLFEVNNYDLKELVKAENIYEPVLSPNMDKIAWIENGRIIISKLEKDGSVEIIKRFPDFENLPIKVSYSDLTWISDEKLLFRSNDELYIMDLSEDTVKKLTSSPQIFEIMPKLSVDNRKIGVFTTEDGVNYGFDVIEISTGKKREVLKKDLLPVNFKWISDKEILIPTKLPEKAVLYYNTDNKKSQILSFEGIDFEDLIYIDFIPFYDRFDVILVVKDEEGAYYVLKGNFKYK